MVCTSDDLNLIFFDSPGYRGNFFQASKSAGGEQAFWHNGPAQSVLLIASSEGSIRRSFRNDFQDAWDTNVDQLLQGQPVDRVGEPIFTWYMFPETDPWLSSNQTYLMIKQNVVVHIPLWPDYQASFAYVLWLGVTADSLIRCSVRVTGYWVASGGKHDKVVGLIKPKVAQGAPMLENAVNAAFQQKTDPVGPWKEVYFLPGNQTTPVENAGFSGNTTDDVTLVLVHQ
jgi:hypothetical protein